MAIGKIKIRRDLSLKKYVRKAVKRDLSAVSIIIQYAKQLLAKKKIPQWQKGTGPNETVLENDIVNGQLFVLVVDEQIAGVGAITREIDPAYEAMQTSWNGCEKTYASIHRFALDPAFQGQGLAKWFLEQLVELCFLAGLKDIRIDTHPKNEAMQQVIVAAGFEKRGIIYLEVPDGERYAYQKGI